MYLPDPAQSATEQPQRKALTSRNASERMRMDAQDERHKRFKDSQARGADDGEGLGELVVVPDGVDGLCHHVALPRPRQLHRLERPLQNLVGQSASSRDRKLNKKTQKGC